VEPGRHAGGSRILGELIDEYGDELDYEFTQAGIDLIEVIAGRTNWCPARLLSFIENLPEDGPFKAALQGGPEFRSWDIKTYLLADLYDAVCTNTVVSGNWAKGKAPKIPPYPRPGAEKAKEEVKSEPQTLEGLHSMFASQLAAGYAHSLI
jgi:hypothetical protein